MMGDAEGQLQAEALGVIEALSAASLGTHSRSSLASAHEVLLSALPGQEVTVAHDVGTHRRASDFKKLQGLLLELSLCPGAVRKDVILAMMYVTQAENQWVTSPREPGRGLARLRRRQTDRADSKAPSQAPIPRQVG